MKNQEEAHRAPLVDTTLVEEVVQVATEVVVEEVDSTTDHSQAASHTTKAEAAEIGAATVVREVATVAETEVVMVEEAVTSEAEEVVVEIEVEEVVEEEVPVECKAPLSLVFQPAPTQ